MPIRTWALGAFVIVGLGLFTALLFLIGDRQKAFAKHVEFQTQFSNLSGLVTGAKVRVSGIDAGKIKSIDIPKSASEKFRLGLEIEAKLQPMIHTDSLVSIETDGVVGDKFLLIKRGTDRTAVAQAGAMLPSKEPFDLSAMLEKASGLLQNVDQTLGDVRGRVDVALDTITGTVNHADGLILSVGPDVQKITRDGSRITGNINGLVADINAGKGPVGMLLRDEETKRQLQSTLANVQQTSVNVDDASARANRLIGDFQSRHLDEKAQAALDNVQALSQQLNATVKEALAEDSMGEDGASNLRQTLSSLNRTTTNLAEDTEALKHNFFFRGFFKKRGFFSLDQITPAEYRQACARRKSSLTRLWLQAAGLMVAGADGKEELSESGRRQIDEAVVPVVNKMAGQTIVVEGYALGTPASQQFALGRRRADQVRRYLEVHYHLRHSDVGIVSLGNTPPAETGRGDWDGAAITLFDKETTK